MVFPTTSYSTKINAKFGSNKKFRLSHPKVGPRHAPNRNDRIAAYDRAFQRYIQKDSKLAAWKQRMDQKGLPGPLVEGYQRSSTSWQHSLSSMSSDSSTCTNDSYTLNRTKNMYDIKPTKSITITTSTSSSPSSPPPLSPPVAPMPKPSVSRRIINSLSLSRSNSKNHSSKVAPTATQSFQRHSSGSTPPHQQKYEGPSVIVHPLPTLSFSILQKHQHLSHLSSRMSLDRHFNNNNNNNNTKRSPCHYAPSKPRISAPTSCSFDDYLSQKRHPSSSFTINTKPLATIPSTRTRSTLIH